MCVTGLTTVDTATYWSHTGQAVILALIQVGGFGIMTLASLIALFLSRRMGLRTRLTAAAETRSIGLGDVRRVLRGVLLITVVVEARSRAPADAAVPRRRTTSTWGTATWHGVFHAVSAFNNAGFALFSDNLMGFLTDGVRPPADRGGGDHRRHRLPGARGGPAQPPAPARWSLHTRLTLLMTAALLVGGTVFITRPSGATRARSDRSVRPTSCSAGWFHAVQPRTAGFNAWDYGAVTDETLLGTIMLMFVGGGSAGTAGGLKVTTFIVLFFVIVAEVRGDEDVIAFDRRIDHRVIRQATTVALLGVAAVVGGTMLLTELTDLPFRDVLFETTSAFATVGLSTGITPQIGDPGQLVLVGADVPRPTRPHHPGVGARPAGAEPPLPLPGRSTPHWLGRSQQAGGVVVIGLGRFGKSLADELERDGVQVLAIDNDPKRVQDLAGRWTHIVQADSTDIQAMEQLGVGDFSKAVIGIGNNLEASVLTAFVLRKLGVTNIWAKAITHIPERDPRRRSASRTSCVPSTPWANGSPTSSAAGCRTTSSSTTGTPSSRPAAPQHPRPHPGRGRRAPAVRRHHRRHQDAPARTSPTPPRRRSSTRATSSSSPVNARKVELLLRPGVGSGLDCGGHGIRRCRPPPLVRT